MKQPADTPASNDTVVSAARWVRGRLVWLLLGCYALAAILPAPGIWLRDLGGDSPGRSVSFSLVAVAVLLVCGATLIDPRQLQEVTKRPRDLAIALSGVWLAPLAGVLGTILVTRATLSAAEAGAVTLGLALAAAMPVANSAVAWTQQSSGAIAWALSLVIASIALCPWVSPMILNWLGAGSGAGLHERVSGLLFFAWVLGPTALGVALRGVGGPERINAWRPVLTLLSATALLLLNYANAAGAMPTVLEEPRWVVLVAILLGASALPSAGAAIAWLAARGAGATREEMLAWVYSLSMKNTGLALGLAGSIVADSPLVILSILAVTLTQHLVAGLIHTVTASVPGQ